MNGELCPSWQFPREMDVKRKARHTELQSVKHGTHINTMAGTHTMTNVLVAEARISC